MAKSKNMQNKNSVSSKSESANMQNCGKNKNSVQNTMSNSNKSTSEKNMEERNEY